MKVQERNDLRAFLKLCGDFEEEQCVFTDVPDLVITTKSSIIGLEHTRIYYEHPQLKSGQQRGAQERLHLSIVNFAHQMFKQRCSVPLRLTVSFSEPFNLRKQDVEPVAKALAEVVLNWTANGLDPIEEKNTTTVSAWEYQRTNMLFPDGIRSFRYKVYDDPRYDFWGPTYGYGVPTLTVDKVKEIIQSKDSKFGEYKKRCDEIWLLLVTDLGMPSSHFRIDDKIHTHPFATKFERLFLLTDGNNKLFELKTVQ